MRARHERFWIGGLGAAGIALAHCVAYLLAAPHGHERDELLALTGHRYWPYALALAGGLCLAGVLGGTVVRLRDGRTAARTGVARVAAVLVPAQIFIFVLVEVVERAVTHGPSLATLTEPVVTLGIALQVLFAVAAATITVLLGRVVDALARRLAPRPRRAAGGSLTRLFIRVLPPRSLHGIGGTAVRGPPQLAV